MGSSTWAHVRSRSTTFYKILIIGIFIKIFTNCIFSSARPITFYPHFDWLSLWIMTVVMILTLTIFLFQAQSVFLLLFGVISTNILPGDKHNQIHFPPNPDGRETPHVDWMLAVADISTGLNCVLMAGREDRGRPGRERETLLSCTNNTRDICRSSSSSSSFSYITEFRPRLVEVRVGHSHWFRSEEIL